MTRLLCPICRRTHFGVRTTHQAHINAHLLAKHNIRVAAANQAHWRQRQDAMWNERNDRISKELREAEKRHKKKVRKTMEKGELPVDHAGEMVLEALKETLARWDEVDEDGDDGDKAESRARERRVDDVDFAMGGDYSLEGRGIVDERGRERKNGVSASLRHYQVAEGRVRAWQQRRELMGRMREAAGREEEQRARVAGGHEDEDAVEEGPRDDQEIEEIREGAVRALAHVKESLARARAGRKRLLRRKVVRMMAEDAASRIQ